jgi:hypothetical protein
MYKHEKIYWLSYFPDINSYIFTLEKKNYILQKILHKFNYEKDCRNLINKIMLDIQSFIKNVYNIIIKFVVIKTNINHFLFTVIENLFNLLTFK